MTPPTQEEELKPCPCCGCNSGEIEMGEQGNLRRFYGTCEECDVNIGWEMTREEAIKAWNTRHNEQEIERVKREMFETGLSIGSRNPGIHETEGVYDKFIGKQSKQAEGGK